MAEEHRVFVFIIVDSPAETTMKQKIADLFLSVNPGEDFNGSVIKLARDHSLLTDFANLPDDVFPYLIDAQQLVRIIKPHKFNIVKKSI